MKTSSLFCVLLLTLNTVCISSVHAQMYKWVGPDGRVSYSDTPPPPSAKKLDPKSVASIGASDSDLPYELNEAVKSNPVTLFTTANCPGCDEARSFLKARGIPFAEKTVNSNDDIAKFKQAGGGSQLPFLKVGGSSQNGFEANAWNAQLTSVGYPQSNMLPKSYRPPKTEAAAPSSSTNMQATTTGIDYNAGNSGAKELPPPVGDNIPPGFRF